MLRKTEFPQVPLEVVKKVVEQQAKQEAKAESEQGTKKEKLPLAGRANGKGRKT